MEQEWNVKSILLSRLVGMPSAVPKDDLTPKGLRTRARIVEVAAQLMFEQGVAGTSIGDIQKAAGVGGSQLYRYFDDKAALTRAVIAFMTEQVLALQEPHLTKLDSIEALRAWRDHVVSIQHDRDCAGGCPIGSLVGQIAELDVDARRDLTDGFTRWGDAITAGIRAMHDRSEIDAAADPDELGLAVLAALQGGLLLTQVRRDTVALEAGLDAVIDRIESLQY